MPFRNITFKETTRVQYNFSTVSTGITGNYQYWSCVAVGNLVVFPPLNAGTGNGNESQIGLLDIKTIVTKKEGDFSGKKLLKSLTFGLFK